MMKVKDFKSGNKFEVIRTTNQRWHSDNLSEQREFVEKQVIEYFKKNDRNVNFLWSDDGFTIYWDIVPYIGQVSKPVTINDKKYHFDGHHKLTNSPNWQKGIITCRSGDYYFSPYNNIERKSYAPKPKKAQLTTEFDGFWIDSMFATKEGTKEQAKEEPRITYEILKKL